MATFNTTDPKPGYVYDSAVDTWFPLLGIAPASQVDRWTKTVAGGETSLSGNDDNAVSLSYTAGTEQVYLNGVLLVRGQDYTASNGTSITGLTALAASDVAEVVTFNPSNIITTDAVLSTDFDAKGDLISASAASTPIRVPVGTNGHVLKANSATTSGLEWSAADDADAIQNSIVAAKGDIISASANDTPAILTVGNNGETLVADSSAATGLSYTAGNPIPNPIINSCFDIFQRGTTFTIGTNTYGPDRWLAFRGAYAAGSTMSRQLVNDSTNLPNIQHCTRIQRDVSNNSTQGINFQYWQETSNSIILAGKTVTLSFYARAGANYSPTSGSLTYKLFTGTGTDQNGATVSYTGSATPINTTATLTTTWQRFSATATLATNTNEYGIAFSNTPVGTAGAADYYEVTGVQIDQGSVALPVRRNGGTIQGELAACQRYCFAVTSGASDRTISSGAYYNSTTFISTVAFPVTMRTTPSATIVTSTNYWIIYANNTTDTADAASFGGAGLNAGNVEITGNASGTTGHGGQLRTNNASASIILSAEL